MVYRAGKFPFERSSHGCAGHRGNAILAAGESSCVC